MLSRFFLVFKIAARNLFYTRKKTINVGAVITVAALTAVIADAFVTAITDGMRRSIVASVSGELQIYSDKARDPLSLFGKIDGDVADLGQIDDFGTIKRQLMNAVPAIKAIVPMGTNFAAFRPGNLLDQKIDALRKAYKSRLGSDQESTVRDTKQRIRELTIGLREDLGQKANGVVRFDKATNVQMFKDIDTALKDEFWRNLDRDHEPGLEFLANKIAPLLIDDSTLFFSYIGAPVSEFARAMPLFEIARGELVPVGKPGILINEHTYETQFKHRIARRLDEMQSKLATGKATIATDRELARMVRANTRQFADVENQLDKARKQELAAGLSDFLATKSRDLSQLLPEFFKMTDQNFALRYRFFYDKIAPFIALHKIAIGESIAVNAMTRRGPETFVDLKLYGTFRFRGLEGSFLAGTFSLIDLASFRKLAGFADENTRRELSQLEGEMGAKNVEETAIAELFSSREGALKNEPKRPPAASKQAGAPLPHTPEPPGKSYSDAEMTDGICLHAAIVLDDPAQRATIMAQIRKVIDTNHLPIQVVDATDAAGLLGQLMEAVQYILFFTLMVMFVIVALIVAGAMVLVAFGRKKEIGTMRAIGAKRGFIMRLIWAESFLLNTTFGLFGLLLGAGIVMLINRAGIVISGDNMQFFLSGSRLHLGLNRQHWGWILAGIFVLSFVTGWLPILKATRITPLSAIQTHE